jgi:hypothetical protein
MSNPCSCSLNILGYVRCVPREGFRPFDLEYYGQWLHTDKIVSVENGLPRGRTKRINTGNGGDGSLLIGEVDSYEKGLRTMKVKVRSDGNSFDMMKRPLLRSKN